MKVYQIVKLYNNSYDSYDELIGFVNSEEYAKDWVKRHNDSIVEYNVEELKTTPNRFIQNIDGWECRDAYEMAIAMYLGKKKQNNNDYSVFLESVHNNEIVYNAMKLAGEYFYESREYNVEDTLEDIPFIIR